MKLPQLPAGCYAHPISRFLDGTVSLDRKGFLHAALKISLESLESPHQDVRALLNPEGNGLVPFLLFVDQTVPGTAGPADGLTSDAQPLEGRVRPEPNDASVHAIQFALSADQGLDWLRYWNEGEFDICRGEWPDAPPECYIGTDPLLEGDDSGQALPPADPVQVRAAPGQTRLSDLLDASQPVDAAIDKLLGEGAKMKFIVILQQIVGGGAGAPLEVTFNWDGETFDERDAAVKHGWALRGSDDFNIGVTLGNQLLDFCWMEESLGESEKTLAGIAHQIGLGD